MKAEVELRKAAVDATLKKYATDQQTKAEVVTAAIKAGAARE